MPPTPSFILYTRANAGEDLARLKEAAEQLRALALRKQWSILREIHEVAPATACGTRPMFEDMLNRLNLGEADSILCPDLPTLSEDPADTARLFKRLHLGEIQCIQTLTKQFVPTDGYFAVSDAAGTPFLTYAPSTSLMNILERTQPDSRSKQQQQALGVALSLRKRIRPPESSGGR